MYAGAWDKNVYCHRRAPDSPNAVMSLSGHTDFVKTVLFVPMSKSPLVISGSADATIVVWDALSGRKLHTLKGHSRGVQALVLESQDGGAAIIFSGDSSREIRRWHISAEASYEISFSAPDSTAPSGPVDPLIAHETSIYDLKFDSDGDLWTASADKTAKCLSRSDGFKADTVLRHPDFVRAIAIYDAGGLVVTACRDENVRVWEKGSGRLLHVYEGHFEEVTGIVVDEERGRAVSVSIDGTVRTWGLKGEDIKKAKEEAEEKKANGTGDTKKESLLTAEEEAELAELMEGDD
ncbi:hypothetical protein, variant [Verruconis gallopava]|nr:hypothetical protein, variant [Verruconis gallopava]KIV98667.1 hypothetical protein, variant [Verruconis gallopava]